MSFRNIQFHNDSTKVQSANSDIVRGAVLSKAAETNGRPVSYILLENDSALLQGGD